MMATDYDRALGLAEEAREVRTKKVLVETRVPGVEIFGSPGSGKTALLEATIIRIGVMARVGVIVAHLAARRDAIRMERAGAMALPVEMAKLDTRVLEDVIEAHSALSQKSDLLFIETPGQLFNGPSPKMDLVARVGVFSITGGDDKAAEYPDRVKQADLILLTKMDLLDKVEFDLDVFRNDVKRINPNAKLIELSASTGRGIDGWIDWLIQRTIHIRRNGRGPVTPNCAEWWFG